MSNSMKKGLLFLFICQFWMMDAGATLYRTTQKVSVRRGAGTKFDVYYTLKHGDTVEQMEMNGKWMKIVYREKEGYVQAKLLTLIPEDTSIPEEKPEPDIDPYEDLDPKTIAGLIAVILAIAGIRKGMEVMRGKKKKVKVGEAPTIKPKPSFWFVCSHCNQKTRSTSRPQPSFCLKADDHNWVNIGQSGDINYHCKHCSTMVLMEKAPYSEHCSAGSHHLWTELGPMGTKHFYCKDCGITVMTTKQPTNINCSNAEAHSWAEL